MLPTYNLTTVQVACVRQLALGKKAKEIRRQFQVSSKMWGEWVRDPNFLAAVEAKIGRLESLVEAGLKEAELDAVATLHQALGAEVPVKQQGGRIKYLPDWSNRIRAAISLLDRRGERGKPVERVQQANFNFNTPEIRNELVTALADPGVRAFLDADPEFAARFRKEVAQLLLPPAEEPCATPESSSASSSPSD